MDEGVGFTAAKRCLRPVWSDDIPGLARGQLAIWLGNLNTLRHGGWSAVASRKASRNNIFTGGSQLEKVLQRSRWIVVMLLVCAWASVASGQAWKPYQFSQEERYEFAVVTYERDGYEDDDWTIPRMVGTESRYAVDIRGTGETSADGEPLFDVGVTTERRVVQSEIGDVAGVTLSSFSNMSFAMLSNPFMFIFLESFFEEVEFEVGERMSIFGIGRASIVGMESHGGREGFVVQLETGSAGERELAGEWVIDPDLAMPIAVRVYDNGVLKSEYSLVAYDG